MLKFGARSALLVGSVLTATLLATSASAQLTEQKYRLTKGDPKVPGEFNPAPVPAAGPTFSNGVVTLSFQGISQYDVASVGRNFVPPDTIAAAGKTQLVQFTNGGFAVFDKSTGNRTAFTSDTSFWQDKAGLAGVPNGDQRVIYNADADRWLAIGFGANTKDINVAVSDTSNALGGWKATKFEGFAELVPGGRTLADFPTLAMDKNAVYIGTNDFAQSTLAGATSFRGTTLNVIPLGDLFNADLSGPSTAGNVQFRTAFTGGPGDDFTRGFAIQGVNSNEASTTGNIIAASINDFGLTRYDVLNAGTAGATRTATFSTTIGTDYTFNDPARQPAVDIPANRRIIDSFGDQIGSSAWEVDGKIYSVHTVTENGSAFTSVRWTILDSVTNQVLDEGNIGDGLDGYDYYQGSLAVNEFGQVVIGYNRSGLDPATGRITLAARTFSTSGSGELMQIGDEIVLRVSDTDDYHNGSLFGQTAVGRQRWADYSSVSLDPEDSSMFWLAGTFAREYNNAAGGHPGGTGGSRWGTFIAAIDFDRSTGVVPEPSTWAIMILGMGVVGASLRRRRYLQMAASLPQSVV